MSETSSQLSPNSFRKRGVEAFPAERGRSISCQQPYDLFSPGVGVPCNSESVEPSHMMQDVSHMEDVHRELQADNLRLWECVNIMRCNPRLVPSQVMQQIYAMSDDEFYRRNPSYSRYNQSGHGALSSIEDGGGSRQPDKYVHHLRVHNDGLMRENARLLVALELLNTRNDRTPDEVISHCFHLSDDAFVRQYPHAARGSRLRAILTKLRGDAKVSRHRSHSLPANTFTRMAPTAQTQTGEPSGPSCSNNNDDLLYGDCRRRGLSPIRSSPHVDSFHSGIRSRSKDWTADTRGILCDRRPSYSKLPLALPAAAATAPGTPTRFEDEVGGRRHSSRSLRKTPLLDCLHLKGYRDLQSRSDDEDLDRGYDPVVSARRRISPDEAYGGGGGGSGRRSTSPGIRGGSPSRRLRKASSTRLRGRSFEERRSSSPVPYMLSHYPYNWATSNNSSIHLSSPHDYEDELRFPRQSAAGLLPHGDDPEDSGVAYRKQRYADWESSSLGTSGVGLDRSASRAKTSPPGPRISYSESPARVTSRCPKLTGTSATGTSTARSTDRWSSSVESNGSPTTSKNTSPRKRLSFLVPRPGQRYKGNSPTTDVSKKFTGKSPGKRNSSGCVSPRKKVSPRKGPYGSILSSTPLLARDNKTPEKKSVTFEQFPRLSQASRLSARDFSEKPKPMYYRPPSEKSKNMSSEDESDDDGHAYAYASRFSQFEDNTQIGRQGFPLLNPRSRSFMFGDEPSTSTPNRLTRPANADTSSSCAKPIDATQNRKRDLLMFRDKLLLTGPESCYDSQRRSRTADGLGRRSSLETPPSLVFNNSYNQTRKKKSSPDSVNKTRPQSTITSLPSINHRPSDSTSSTHSSLASKARCISPKGKPAMPVLKTTAMPYLKQMTAAVSLTCRKPHRCPTRRSSSVSPERKRGTRGGDEKTRTSPRKAHRPRQNFRTTDENANRYQSESLSSSEQPRQADESSSQDQQQQPFLERLLSMPESGESGGEESVVDQLRREKRQLYSKYSKEGSAPRSGRTSSAPAASRLIGQCPDEENDLHDRLSCFSEPCPRLSTLDVRDFPRTGGRCSASYPERDASRPSAVQDGGGVAPDSLQGSVENLCKLRDETSMNRLRRERRLSGHDAEMELAFKSAYDNLGTPVLLEANNHRHSHKNKNHNSPRPKPSSSWLKLIEPDRESCDTDGYSHVTQKNLERMTQEAEESNRAFYDAPMTLLGEVAFQLERRIIRHVFDESTTGTTNNYDDDDDDNNNDYRYRFYGFTVLNLLQKIRSESREPETGKRNGTREARLLRRFQDIISFLRDSCGYQVHKHSKLSQELINRHGLFGQPPDVATVVRLGLDDFRSVRNHVIKLSDSRERPDVLVLVDCLHALCEKEEVPILNFGLL